MTHPVDRYGYWIEAAISYYEDAEDLRMAGGALHHLICILYARSARSGLNAICAAADIETHPGAIHLSALLRRVEPSRPAIERANLHADARTLTRALQLDQCEVGSDLLVRDLFDREIVNACNASVTRILEPIVADLLGAGLSEAQMRFSQFRRRPMIGVDLWQRRHPIRRSQPLKR